MKEIKVRYPMNWQVIISMSMICLLTLWTSIISGDRYRFGNLIISVVCGGIVVFTIIRSNLKPKTLELQQQRMKIGHTYIYATDIKNIFIEGSCIIGVRPRNRKITPLSLTLKIMGTDEVELIIKWAHENKVEIKYRTFMKWL
ncbi:hypothetical protein [Paenibacillus sp. NFR01]|uniref:hypothetical protein n=1 Tax=Paenibacillus sp. NFR01 TaxID=1566279 RepID=UPI0008B6BA0B|nr:hypothetical protein [Paenibacillus sp. NFR01]SES88679.1 hypothetical protein SAMN03159358_0208 [Paenibacillus sp. NFR01]